MSFLLLAGCATMSSLPKTANDVNFDSKEGKTGWSKYEETFFFRGVDKRTTYLAAKSGLSDAEFTVTQADFEKGYAKGKHGMTAYDWNIVAGVYVKEIEGGTQVKIVVEGSKDIGFMGDMTDQSWPQKIYKGMRDYVQGESSITDPNKKIFQ